VVAGWGESEMRIVSIYISYYPERGGIQNVIRFLNECLQSKGHLTQVVCLTNDGVSSREIIKGVEVFRIVDKYYSYLYGYSIPFRAFFFDNRPVFDQADVIHIHGYSSLLSWQVIRLLNSYGYSSKLIFTPHYEGIGFSRFRNLLHVVYKHLAKSSFEYPELISFVSEYEKNNISCNFQIDPRKIRVIANGINYPVPCESTVKYLNERHINILFVGRLERKKGVQYLLRALPILDREKNLSINLFLVGEGSYSDDLRSITSELGLSNVHFMGRVSDDELNSLYNSSDIFVMLSQSEAYGIVVAEALARGLITIVSNTTALTEFVGEAGCIGVDYPPDVDEIVALIKSLIGKEVVVGPFNSKKIRNWTVVADEYEKCYMELIEGDVGAPY
jgi:glycosyltransferase involved in cell wall biosynthesis